MQAPTTTDGGPSGSDPRARACAACGAENSPSASFCWRCYRPLEHPPTGWPAPPTAISTDSRGRTSNLGRMASIAAVAVGVIAAAAFVVLRQSGPSFPQAISGLERVSNAQTDAAAGSFRAASEADGLDADMAFYGSGSVPEAVHMWIRGADGSVVGPSEAFDALAQGFTSGYNGTLEMSGRTDHAIQGITYVCAPITGALGAGICMWEEDDVFWVLLDVRPGSRIGETNDLAVAARNAASCPRPRTPHDPPLALRPRTGTVSDHRARICGRASRWWSPCWGSKATTRARRSSSCSRCASRSRWRCSTTRS